MFMPFGLFVLTYLLGLIGARADDYSTAGLNTTWIASASSVNYTWFSSVGAGLIPVLLQSHNGSTFACGLYSEDFADTYHFAIVIVPTDLRPLNSSNYKVTPLVVWSANRNSPVGTQATLELTVQGNLVLKDANSSVAWSTQTDGRSVAGMDLTDTGNLVLFDKNNAALWQSFDHPTDTLLLQQKLRVGQKLIASISGINRSEGLYSLSLTTEGLFAQIETDPPQAYYHWHINFPNTSSDSNYVVFTEGHFELFVNFERNDSLLSGYNSTAAVQFLKFEFDGHGRVYQAFKNGFTEHDTLTESIGFCGYPMVCGSYGICEEESRTCRCPDHYFKPIDNADPPLGCAESIPSSCEASQSQSFFHVGGVSYFAFRTGPQRVPDLVNSDEESCKKACADNCPCRAALFQNVGDGSNYSGSCYLESQVSSFIDEPDLVHPTAIFLKVQNTKDEDPTPPINSKRVNVVRIVIITSSLGSLLAFIFLVAVMKGRCRRKGAEDVEEEKGVDEVEEGCLDQVPGAPKRFTYDDLKTITEDFDNKLGDGGFGSVYQGTLADGEKVAVKQLNGLHQTKKSFLAEVKSIGNIHHLNLVRLVGFCAEESHRLLVYEFMSNGSLDKWIFRKLDESFVLDWQQRKKIIFDIAKGLCYLHEECRWKIVHMDIKSQNILLDEKFNAKVADFGLSKLIDRDQSQIVTTMRGTPGYLAPEWLHAAITEKVDVYSFGVVILEIVCERKVFDESENQEDMYLLGVFKRKWEEGRLLDMIDKNNEDMQLNGPHVINMMRLAAWCLQVDFTKRPSLSMAIKVLEGMIEVPTALDYNLSYPTLTNVSIRIGQEPVESHIAISVVPSILSGPR